MRVWQTVREEPDSPSVLRVLEDHVWFEDRWMVASLCDE
jgi:hypothetical protein